MNDLAKIATANGSDLVERSREAMRLMSNAFEAESAGRREQETALAALEAAGPALAALKARLEAGLQPATEKEIATALAMLLKAFPNVGKDDGAAFGRLLLEDVISQRPTAAALQAGCAQVRRTSKFLPSIAEVLEAITACQSAMETGANRLSQVEGQKSALVTAIRENAKVTRLRDG